MIQKKWVLYLMTSLVMQMHNLKKDGGNLKRVLLQLLLSKDLESNVMAKSMLKQILAEKDDSAKQVLKVFDLKETSNLRIKNRE